MRAAHTPPCAAAPGSGGPGRTASSRFSDNGARSTATSIPATSVACLSSASRPHGAQHRSTSSSHSIGMSGSSSRSIARRSVARTRSITTRLSGRSPSAPPTMAGGCCGSTELRPSCTIDHGRSAAVMVGRGAEVVRRRVGDQRLPDPLPRRCGAVGVGGPSTVVSPDRNGRVISAPACTSLPAGPKLIGQFLDDEAVGRVRVQHLDRGAVPVGVDIAQHRFGRAGIRLGGLHLSSPRARSRPGSTAPGRSHW